MKITLVTETYLPFIAGVSSSSDSIARFMAKKGHQVTIISPRPVLPTTKSEQDLNLIYTPSTPDFIFKGKPMSLWPLPLPVMIREITKEKVNILHIQEAGALGIAALITAKIRKIKVVGALHLTPEQIVRFIKINPFNLTVTGINFLLKVFYNSCDALMVPTQTFAQMLGKIGVRKKIVVVSNGVDTGKFAPGEKDQEVIKKYQLPQDKILFFFLGRMDKDKNIDTIIKALSLTSDKIHLIIAGQGAEENNLKQLAHEQKVYPKITWLGFIPDSDIVKLYNSMDGFILMSPFEVQSIVTLQAISCGLPVICSKEGALPELCHDNQNGFLIDTYNFQTLAQKMEILTDDENLRKKFGDQSREISLPHEKNRNLQKLEDLYKSLTLIG